MTLRVIRPTFANAEAVFPKLVSSDFAAAYAAPAVDGALWNSGTSYTIGQRAYVLGTTNKLYQALTANTNKPPATSPTDWIEVSYTNTYRMFDTVNSSQSKATGPTAKTVVFDAGRINAIYIGNISGVSTVNVLVKNGATTVYSKTVNMAANNVFNWYDYWFAPIILQDALALFDLPPYSAARVTLTFTGGGEMAVGTVQVGMFKDLGQVQWQPNVRHLDYSTYKTDTFGNVTIKPQLPAKVISARVFVPRVGASFDDVNREMEDLTGKVVVWSFLGDKYPSLNALGFKNDFDHVLDNSAGSMFNLKVQGLI